MMAQQRVLGFGDAGGRNLCNVELWQFHPHQFM